MKIMLTAPVMFSILFVTAILVYFMTKEKQGKRASVSLSPSAPYGMYVHDVSYRVT
jgi:hypothetical protein